MQQLLAILLGRFVNSRTSRPKTSPYFLRQAPSRTIPVEARQPRSQTARHGLQVMPRPRIPLYSEVANGEVAMLKLILILLLAVISSSAIAAPAVGQVEPTSATNSQRSQNEWITAMSKNLEARIPNHDTRMALLKAVHYESSRAGVNPQVVLSLIDVTSGFKKYAVSTEGARGYMQVSPSWVKLIGAKDDDLFSIRKNIRYGCVFLRHFLDEEQGDLLKALGRYRSQMGGEVENQLVVSPAEFPETVERLSKTRWRFDASIGYQK